MPDGYNYPADLQRDEDGRHVVAFPDFGWGATDGATKEEALAEAAVRPGAQQTARWRRRRR